jgi:hypothetical protein
VHAFLNWQLPVLIDAGVLTWAVVITVRVLRRKRGDLG